MAIIFLVRALHRCSSDVNIGWRVFQQLTTTTHLAALNSYQHQDVLELLSPNGLGITAMKAHLLPI